MKDDDGKDALVDYFITHTNARFDKLETKVDQLISFRVMLVGAAMGVSGLVSIAINIGLAIFSTK